MRKRARVALLIDTATTWGSGLIEGIADYAHNSAEWHLFLGPFGKYDHMLMPQGWDGEGVIARVNSQELADQLVQRQIPAVNVSWYTFGDKQIPRCTCDEVDIARRAVEYFLDRGFRQFAYCGSSVREHYVDRVGQAYVDTLQSQAHACARYTPQADPEGFLPRSEDLNRLTTWLQGLPKPVALLAFDSIQARFVTEACQLAGIEVPHEVAVLGGEHDLLSCTISKPELSSIDHSPHRVGFAAAEMLAKLMEGEQVRDEPMLLPASRVITRQSTDTVALNDDLLAACVQFIKSNSHKRIQVSDILASVPISRRALEKGFRKHLSRSPAEEIRRVRVLKAVTLLCDTSWPMPKIASACGFDRPELLTRAFRRELDMTPSQFRKQAVRKRQDEAMFPTGLVNDWNRLDSPSQDSSNPSSLL
ncbi:MAG: DNA-binding transcriptional regulator [Planctomycetota bacterium]